MAYNSISIKHYIKSHLELQREITLIELAPSPYYFVSSICLAYMNMFARFDENPAMTLRVIKETKRYGRTDTRTDTRTDARTDTRTDNVKTVYPLQTKFAGGINIVYPDQTAPKQSGLSLHCLTKNLHKTFLQTIYAAFGTLRDKKLATYLHITSLVAKGFMRASSSPRETKELHLFGSFSFLQVTDWRILSASMCRSCCIIV